MENEKYTTDSVREVIIRSREQKMGIREITKEVNKNPSTVSRILKRYEEEDTTMVRAKSGRPKKTNDCDERALSRLSKTNPKLTTRQLKENWAMGPKVRITTVKRRLRRYNFHGRIAAPKPKLTRQQMRNRLNFAKTVSTNGTEDWER